MTLTRKAPVLPKIILGQDFWEGASKVIVGDILDRIDKQQEPDGGALKRNAASTLKRKQKLGLGSLSLVAKEHRFVRGGFSSYAPEYLPGGRGVSIAPSTGEAMTIAGHLVRKGYRWIGLSKHGMDAIRAWFRQYIERSVRGSR